MNKCVLDASAILALLNDESGAEMVQELLPSFQRAEKSA